MGTPAKNPLGVDSGLAESSRIRRLDEAVVNKIAAGEVIHRPASALKELLENSIDAGATHIQVVLKEGGLKMLQIHDDGRGIHRDDLAIVCERFTTSKLERFEDLASIATYGFRGEALASISHVAHVTIVSRTADSTCAYRACYADGKLSSSKSGETEDPKPCAGNVGTQITVEDLFYNMSMRRRAMKSATDEYSRVLDVLQRYAIHNSGIGFTCKKHGSAVADLLTPSAHGIVDNIRLVYGNTIARELLEFNVDDDRLAFQARGFGSNANFNMKKSVFLLFINHRAVESSNLRKSLDGVYSAFLPKQTHAFVYLSLNVKPQNVDVNVHPTKSEVHFLYEDAIIERIATTLQTALMNSNSSRTFSTQTLLPVTMIPAAAFTQLDGEEATRTTQVSPKSIDPSRMVRVDSRARTLHSFVSSPLSAPDRASASRFYESSNLSPSLSEKRPTIGTPSGDLASAVADTVAKKARTDVRLRSIQALRDAVQKETHSGLYEIFREHIFVGCVNEELALVQCHIKLYLINYAVLSKDLFYQVALQEFSNFGTIDLNPPASINDLLDLYFERCEPSLDGDRHSTKASVIKSILARFLSNSAMLRDYFCLEISDKGLLHTLPLMLIHRTPDLTYLPSFLYRLATNVNWLEEKSCLHDICCELATFYSLHPEPLDTSVVPDDDPSAPGQTDYQHHVQHLVFPAFRSRFYPSTRHAADGTVIQIACLPDLYKVFERC